MKKLIVTLSLLILVSFAFALSAAPSTEAAPQSIEAVPAEQVSAPAEEKSAAPAACNTEAGMFPGPNYCGDPCDEEGEMTGCIDTSGPVWERTICTCSGGYLVC